MDMPSALPPAPGPDAFIPLLGGAPAPGALPGAIVAPGAIIAPAGVPAVAPLAAPVDVARTPISAPVNLTPRNPGQPRSPATLSLPRPGHQLPPRQRSQPNLQALVFQWWRQVASLSSTLQLAPLSSRSSQLLCLVLSQQVTSDSF